MPPDSCQVLAWRPAVPGVSEVFHARIAGWSYPRHAHDTWTVLILDEGAINFSMDRRLREVHGSVVTLIPPGVVHDGRPAPGASAGFRKRNLYLHRDFLPPELVGRAVDRTTISDTGLRRTVSAIHDGLRAGEDPMHAEERLALVAGRLARHLRGGPPVPKPRTSPRADALRDLLDQHLTEPYLLRDAAAEIGVSVATLVRDFRRAFDLAPHAYVVARRIELARTLLLDGVSVADVAVRSGFHDQPHLTRHFKRHVTTTPARYVHGIARKAGHTPSTRTLDW